MRKKILNVAIVLAVVVGAAAALTATPASTKCPRNSHLVTCSTYSFCCPDNALCVCTP